MKTAVSIPDKIFHAAERHAKRVGIPRSRLYAEAIAEYLKNQRLNSVKDALDQVYGAQPSEVDSVIDAMQRASIPREDW